MNQDLTADDAASRLDSAIERITSKRPSASSRTNSVASSVALPSAADPGYTRDASLPRRSIHSETSSLQSDAHINAQLYNHRASTPREATQRQGSAEDWAEKGASRRTVQSVVNGVRQERVIRKGVRDFNFARTLGEGSYSTVIAATDRQTLKEYAIKVLDKRHIIKERKVKYVNIEKNTLFRLGDHPGVVRLYYTFQDESSLYFVLDLAANGELLGVLKKLTTFDEECARYYSAQILDAISYMHSKGVIHRDLKPENVLLDERMRVKIADFGTAKLLDMPAESGRSNGKEHREESRAEELEGLNQSDRANSFVGTAEYVSPELLTEKSTCKSSDLWALGCILYQLLAGKPPFKAVNEYQTFQKIVKLDYTIPTNFPPKAADLISRLLVLDPLKRLSVPEIRKHEFFSAIDWETLWKIKAPKLRPYRPPPIVLNAAPTQARLARPAAPRQTSSQHLRNASSVNEHGNTHHPPSPGNRIDGEYSTRGQRPQMMESASPSELDLQYSSVLSLPFERIVRLGQLTVMTSDGDRTPRKFNKLLQRKRTRVLMITTHGRCVYLDPSGDKKVRGEMNMTGPTSTSVRQIDAKQFIVETPSKSFLYEDANGSTGAWLEALNEANHRCVEFRDGPNGNGHRAEEKRKSRITLGLS